MKFVKEIFTQTLEVKQSKFIACLTPFLEYKTTLKTLQEQHPKARHFVVAYRHLNEFSQTVEHSSDDGEPKGTSGKPSLMVLQGQNLINTAVIIVRYFGGTKLGTGGLVRAYSDAVNLVVSQSEFFEYVELHEQKLSFEYAQARVVEYECEVNNITIVAKEYLDNVHYVFHGTKEALKLFELSLKKRNIIC